LAFRFARSESARDAGASHELHRVEHELGTSTIVELCSGPPFPVATRVVFEWKRASPARPLLNPATVTLRILPIVLLAGVLGAAGLAIFRPGNEPVVGSSSTSPPLAAAELASELEGDMLPPNHPSVGASTGLGEAQGDVLPPNHPPIGGAQGSQPALLPVNDDQPAIAWKVPPAWQSAPNPNAMRLATYRAPASSKSHEPADVSVTRAGGTPDANIERWLSQFDDAGAETRSIKTVRGLKITIVEVSGTFTGGSMTPGTTETPRRGWALLGAIVETPGSPYFFKITGEAATVHGARASLVALLESITPA
jgi:hypothetical protein